MAKPSPIDLQKALKDASYPSTRDKLVELAEKNRADSGMVDLIRKLPDREYDGPNDVSKEVFD